MSTKETLFVPGAPATDIPWGHEEWASSPQQRTVLVPAWGQVQVATIQAAAGGPAPRVVVNGYGRTDDEAAGQHAAVTAWASCSD